MPRASSRSSSRLREPRRSAVDRRRGRGGRCGVGEDEPQQRASETAAAAAVIRSRRDPPPRRSQPGLSERAKRAADRADPAPAWSRGLRVLRARPRRGGGPDEQRLHPRLRRRAVARGATEPSRLGARRVGGAALNRSRPWGRRRRLVGAAVGARGPMGRRRPTVTPLARDTAEHAPADLPWQTRAARGTRRAHRARTAGGVRASVPRERVRRLRAGTLSHPTRPRPLRGRTWRRSPPQRPGRDLRLGAQRARAARHAGGRAMRT